MSRFIKADALPHEELQARLAAGTLKPCALGPCGGEWYVTCEPGDESIIAGLPGSPMIAASGNDTGTVEWEFPADE